MKPCNVSRDKNTSQGHPGVIHPVTEAVTLHSLQQEDYGAAIFVQLVRSAAVHSNSVCLTLNINVTPGSSVI